jgi:dihydrofolate synthase/folylpolyglutamate synthase
MPLYAAIELDLGGNYQQKNILTIINAVEHLRNIGYTLSEQHLRAGLKNVKSNTGLMGRWQVLQQSPLTVCDTGHNVDGISYVVEQIRQNRFERLHMVIGMVKDKDIGKVLALLPRGATYYFCNAALPRALPADELQQQSRLFQLNGSVYPSVHDAFEAAKNNAGKDDMIFIGGSTFVVAEVL